MTSRVRGRPQLVLEVEVSDPTGALILKWFRGGDRLAETLVAGTRLLVTGDVRRFRFRKELIHPEIEMLGASPAAAEGAELGLDSQRRVVPEYSCPDGIPPRTLRRWVEAAVADSTAARSADSDAAASVFGGILIFLFSLSQRFSFLKHFFKILSIEYSLGYVTNSSI